MAGTGTVPAEADRHAWERMEPGWHIGFALFLGAAGALLLLDEPRPALPLGLVLVVAVAYGCTGGPALHGGWEDRRGGVYLAIAVPSVLVLFFLTPVGAVLLFALFPQIWRLLRTRAAVLTSVATMLGIAGVQLADAEQVNRVQILAWTAGTIVCSVLLGLWITRIAEQSERRSRLVAELESTRAELAGMSREAGALAERERLARDIHDTLAQGFTSLLLLVRTTQDEIDTDPAAARRHLALAARTARQPGRGADARRHARSGRATRRPAVRGAAAAGRRRRLRARHRGRARGRRDRTGAAGDARRGPAPGRAGGDRERPQTLRGGPAVLGALLRRTVGDAARARRRLRLHRGHRRRDRGPVVELGRAGSGWAGCGRGWPSWAASCACAVHPVRGRL